jgi:cytochrome P450
MEGMMHERIGKLVERLQASMESGQPVTLDSAFSALTADIITQRFYGEHFDYLSIPDYKMAVTEAFLGVSLIFHLARFIPGLVSTLKKMPIPVIRMILPPVAELLVLQDEIKNKILTSLEEASKEKEESKSVIVSALGDPTIPPPERAIDRLLDEGTVIIFAGTETSSRALSVGMFHLLSDKTKLQKLRDELKQLPFKPDNDYSMAQLEPLPYLVCTSIFSCHGFWLILF